MHHQGTALPTGQGTSEHDRPRTSRVAYTVAEFAALLGKHPNTVYDWIRKGLVPAERIGLCYFIPERALGRLRDPSPAQEALTAPAPGGEAA
jgi:excisionase family DNA binding protein